MQRAGFPNPRTAPPERQRSSNSFKQIAGGRNVDASGGGADGTGGSVVAAVSRCNYGSSSLLHQQLHQDVGAVNTAANYCSLRWSNLNKARSPSAQAGLVGKRCKYVILSSIPLQIFIKMQRFCNKRTSRYRADAAFSSLTDRLIVAQNEFCNMELFLFLSAPGSHGCATLVLFTSLSHCYLTSPGDWTQLIRSLLIK